MLRAVLRLLRRDDPDGRRRTTPGDAARARLPARPRRARGPRSRPRPGSCCSTPRTTRPARVLDPRRAGRRSPRSPIEHDLVVITDEVYEHLIFDDDEHVPLATLPGHGRAHADPVQRRQVLLLHRLEGRLGHRPGGARRPPCWPPSSGSPSPPAHRSSPRSRYALDEEPDFPRRAGRRPRSSGVTCSATGLARARASTCGSRRAPTSRPPTSATSAGPTAWRSAWRCPSGPAWWRSRPRSFYDDRDDGPAPGPLGVLQGPRRHRGGHPPPRVGGPALLSRPEPNRPVSKAGRSAPGPGSGGRTSHWPHPRTAARSSRSRRAATAPAARSRWRTARRRRRARTR